MIYTKENIKEQLKEMGAPGGSVVLVHSALRLVGEVEGGGGDPLASEKPIPPKWYC